MQGLVLPPAFILQSRVDTVTQDFVSEGKVPGLLFSVYIPVKDSTEFTQSQVRELLSFSGYTLLQSRFEVVPVSYQWRRDTETQLWESVPVTGPSEYVKRAPPAIQTTATPNIVYLDNAPKFVVVYQAILRPLDGTIQVSKIDQLLSTARNDLRDKSISNALFSVNVQGVEPTPKNDLSQALAKLAVTVAVGTAGFLVAKAAFTRTRL